MTNEELVNYDDTHNDRAKVFNYEGSFFVVIRTDATVDVHYMITVEKALDYMGSFKSVASGIHFNKRLTEFIDYNIQVMMDKQEKKHKEFNQGLEKEKESL